jgi:hypothetical protein
MAASRDPFAFGAKSGRPFELGLISGRLDLALASAPLASQTSSASAVGDFTGLSGHLTAISFRSLKLDRSLRLHCAAGSQSRSAGETAGFRQ